MLFPVWKLPNLNGIRAIGEGVNTSVRSMVGSPSPKRQLHFPWSICPAKIVKPKSYLFITLLEDLGGFWEAPVGVHMESIPYYGPKK